MKPKQQKQSVDLKSMSVDEFMKTGLGASDDNEDSSGEEDEDECSDDGDDVDSNDSGEEDGAAEDGDPSFVIGTDDTGQSGMLEKKDDSEEDSNSDDEGDWTSKNFSHKKALLKLKDTDPEFFQYLQENDKELLEFDASESEDEEKGEEVHQPPDSLEVGSDESDYEGDEKKGEDGGSGVITLKLVKEWEEKLKKTTPRKVHVIKEVTQAFRAVLARVSSEEDSESRFKITGSSVFNAVIQLCVLEIQPALKKYLKMHSPHVPPTKHKQNWPVVRNNVKHYISNLVKLLGAVQSPDILAVMLKHLHQMMPFAACFAVLRQPLLKMLVQLWSSSEDTVRIISFLCLLKLTTLQQDKLLERVLKMMYLSYVRNSKFVSPSTLSAINFMRRSLVEIFVLDLKVAYQHVFLYIRQLAIHLRNAMTLQKKESMQAVYNWQFVNSIHLWAELLGATAGKEQLEPLIYPLIQVTIGTIKLIPTAQYYPLRFHCSQILIKLSKQTCTFIPILPFLLEVLNSFDFNKAHSKVSMKPIEFKCLLRVSKTQMLENGFKDVIIDHIYKQMLEYLTNEACSIAFPDLVIPTVIQLKKFLKTCKVSNHCRKMKQVLDKIQENARFVEQERSKVAFKLSDQKSIAAWESQLQMKGTPLMAFHSTWADMQKVKEAKKQTQNDKLGDFNLPVLKKRPREVKTGDEGPVELFPSDESDGSDDNILKLESEEEDEPPRKKRGKRSGKGIKRPLAMKNIASEDDSQNIEDHGDIVEDLTLESLEKA